ncbi:LysR family transcriptional regulator [uncultured Roseobacter sp.]|uniref:LysR family transcriptional regulator n=1 Tax=uncultured Roseobacter sp. TaxID=114847 RepID=UPI00260CD817|nr:LysR family transcriptional regulator [uncultured Roseobacter sp.]
MKYLVWCLARYDVPSRATSNRNFFLSNWLTRTDRKPGSIQLFLAFYCIHQRNFPLRALVTACSHYRDLALYQSMGQKFSMENFDILRLDGHTLRVFLMVYEIGSISRTADVFNLNQSTISHTVDKMRAAVGDPLFVKSGRGITPTERAETIAPRVQEILAGLEGLVAVKNYEASRDTLPFCIGLPTPALIPQIKIVQDTLSALAPNVQFRVGRLAPRERMSEMLSLAEIDLAIAINVTNLPATLNSARYGEDNLVIYYDPNMRSPIETVEEYAKANHCVAGLGGNSKSIVETALDLQGLKRKITLISPTASTLGQFVAGTDMIATMPLGLARESYRDLAYCVPPFTLPQLNYDLVWHRKFENSGRNKWFRDLLLEHSG